MPFCISGAISDQNSTGFILFCFKLSRIVVKFLEYFDYYDGFFLMLWYKMVYVIKKNQMEDDMGKKERIYELVLGSGEINRPESLRINHFRSVRIRQSSVQ